MSELPEQGERFLSAGPISVPLAAISFAMSRASGPGGQNVNKVNTRVELRVPLNALEGLSDPMRQRLEMLAGKKLTAGGELRIVSQETRSQEMNRDIVLAMLRQLLLDATQIPKTRRATRPTRGSKRRRLEGKKRRGEIKRGRQGME